MPASVFDFDCVGVEAKKMTKKELLQAVKERIKRGREIKRDLRQCLCINKGKMRYKLILRLEGIRWNRGVIVDGRE